jgi:pimeloyl-ACP methyl ester carboxylesterase
MYEEQWIETNGIRLHVVFAGLRDGRPIVLLHGFPEFWYAWRQQIEPLAAAGYRVIVPDQRGYNLSDKPKGVQAYHVDQLSRDIVELLDRSGFQTVDLVGHDWGGVIAWKLATDAPHRFRHLVVLNAPHLDSLQRAYVKHPIQILESWYIVMVQVPWFAEHLFFWPFANRGFRLAKPGSLTAEDLARYREAWTQPGAVHATINWYRSSFRSMMRNTIAASTHPTPADKKSTIAPIRVPTLVLWGAKDMALSTWLARDSAAMCFQGPSAFFQMPVTDCSTTNRTR